MTGHEKSRSHQILRTGCVQANDDRIVTDICAGGVPKHCRVGGRRQGKLKRFNVIRIFSGFDVYDVNWQFPARHVVHTYKWRVSWQLLEDPPQLMPVG